MSSASIILAVILVAVLVAIVARELRSRRPRHLTPVSYTHLTWAASAHAKSPLWVLNVMSLGNPQSAILSAIIFNAIVIPLLIPLSLRGVRYRPIGASALLRRNLLLYGLGGIIAPFIGIKAIDLIVHNLLGG